MQSLVGLLGLLGLAWLLSNNRRHVDLRLVLWGTGLQLIFAFLILATTPGRAVFSWMNDAVIILLGFTEKGASFVFGNLIKNNVPVGTPLGDPTMGPVIPPNQTSWANTGAFFAFNILPTIIFFSSLMTVLYHARVMQHAVSFFARIMQSTMKTSGSETLSSAANIFLGQTEAPLCVKPYVPAMTNSELMAVMVGGFANTAGGVLAAYVGMLKGHFPDIAGHLISVSVMSAPASLVIAKIMFPETEQSMTRGRVKMSVEKIDANVIDAAARGASEGLALALNVGAMLIAFIALVAMINWGVGALGGLVGHPDLSLQLIFGYLFWPLAWMMGIPAGDCAAAGQLLGTKTVLNEFAAYLDLSAMLQNPASPLRPRSIIIVTYALCGFANFASIAIQIGGIGGMAPNRRSDLARLGLRAMIGGSIATFMCAAIAGLLI
ncbi:MAG: NupC/NupG family nucleoside CNT transporter [Candidatus Schekmanbacteria bacterium]|nr:NupC/NupG family nucleoside CNT transporter [Candidatus Schekmanbacteria bacterium]